MRYFHKNKNQFHCPIINLDKIWSLVGEEVRSCGSLNSLFFSIYGCAVGAGDASAI